MEEMCPFCSPSADEIVISNALCYARYDRYPVSPGHTLILPFRHIGDFFDLTPEEQEQVWELVFQLRNLIKSERKTNGFNIGINVGRQAGQTVMHAHIHLIPRFPGDIDDPEGGVRGVIPEKRIYRKVPKL